MELRGGAPCANQAARSLIIFCRALSREVARSCAIEFDPQSSWHARRSDARGKHVGQPKTKAARRPDPPIQKMKRHQFLPRGKIVESIAHVIVCFFNVITECLSLSFSHAEAEQRFSNVIPT